MNERESMAGHGRGTLEHIGDRGPFARRRSAPEHIGAKAEGLWFLARRDFRIPPTFALTFDADPGVAGDAMTASTEWARAAHARPVLREGPLAVRSSADVEDGSERSFAGQFESVLGVEGEGELGQAIRFVWEKARSDRVYRYAESAGIDAADIRIAVIVQQQVAAEVSGVAFGKNPLTGLDEVVVEAVRGTGEALGRDGVTPSRWVWKWGEFTEETDLEDIGRDLVRDVVEGTRRIQKAYGAPVDVEWCWDGTNLWWVQVREITALKTARVYSNRISREVLPGLIRPLVWSVNTRLVNGAWVQLITEIVGATGIAPRSLSRTFYYRAYFDMGTFGRIFEEFGMPRESLEIIMGIESSGEERPSLRPSAKSLRHMPRLVRFAVDKLRYSRRIDAFIEQAQSAYDSFSPQDAARCSDEELLGRIEDLFDTNHEAAYLNIVTPLLAQFYSRRFTRRLESAGVDPGTFDTRGSTDEWAEVDPARALADLKAAYDAASSEVQHAVDSGNTDALRESEGAGDVVAELDSYLQRFGHLSDSGNDFSAVPWLERPSDILKNVGAQRASEPTTRVTWGHLSLPRLTMLRLRPPYHRARRYEWYREAVGSTYTRAYGLFRVYFLEAGRRLTERGQLRDATDVFFLYYDELVASIRANVDIDVPATVARRSAEFDAAKSIIVPETVFGDDPVPVEPGTFTELTGTPTSRGQYRGRAVQVSGLADADKLEEGDVLFVPFTDVAWTPLFARAGAVVAESGGFLSHSSIVARERGIPAVVSVAGAMRVPDGAEVIVDGFTGTVRILGEDDLTASDVDVATDL